MGGCRGVRVPLSLHRPPRCRGPALGSAPVAAGVADTPPPPPPLTRPRGGGGEPRPFPSKVLPPVEGLVARLGFHRPEGGSGADRPPSILSPPRWSNGSLPGEAAPGRGGGYRGCWSDSPGFGGAPPLHSVVVLTAGKVKVRVGIKTEAPRSRMSSSCAETHLLGTSPATAACGDSLSGRC